MLKEMYNKLEIDVAICEMTDIITASSGTPVEKEYREDIYDMGGMKETELHLFDGDFGFFDVD